MFSVKDCLNAERTILKKDDVQIAGGSDRSSLPDAVVPAFLYQCLLVDMKGDKKRCRSWRKDWGRPD